MADDRDDKDDEPDISHLPEQHTVPDDVNWKQGIHVPVGVVSAIFGLAATGLITAWQAYPEEMSDWARDKVEAVDSTLARHSFVYRTFRPGG